MILPDGTVFGIDENGVPRYAPWESFEQLAGIKKSIFGSNLAVPSGVETGIMSYSVPVGKKFRITGFSSWADVDAEYFVKINGTQVDGGRSSIAEPTISKSFFFAEYLAFAGDIIVIAALRQSPALALKFNAVLHGVLHNV